MPNPMQELQLPTDLREQPDREQMPVIALTDQVVVLDHQDPDDPDDDGRRRSTIQLMAGGQYEHFWFGNLVFDEELFDGMVAKFNEGVIRRQIAIDVDHEAGLAYGWIEAVWREGEGEDGSAFFARIRWTTPGVELIEGELYKYTSAEMAFNWKDNRGKLHGPTLLGTALTNRPFIAGMQEVTLAASEHAAYFDQTPDLPTPAALETVVTGDQVTLNEPIEANTSGPHIDPDSEGTDPMLLSEDVRAAIIASGLFAQNGDTPEAVETTFLTAIRANLGLAEDTPVTDEAMATAIEAVFTELKDATPADPKPEDTPPVTLTDTPPTPEPVTPTPESVELADDASPEVIALTATVNELQGQVAAMGQQNKLLLAERDDARATALLDEARATGKTTPAMETAFLNDLARSGDVAKFRATVDALTAPEHAPTSVVGLDGDNADLGMTTGDAEAAFMARVNAVAAEKGIEFGDAYIEVKNGHLDEGDRAIYHAYADQANLGVAQRRREVAEAAHVLKRDGALLTR